MPYASLVSTPGLSYNYSLYAIPVGWIIAMAPLWWAAPIANKAAKGSYDNANPKDSWANIDSKPIPLELKGRVKRAIAAENNTHTNLPLFAAALVAANAAHVDASSLHFYAGLWVISRIAYTFAYILIEDRKSRPSAQRYLEWVYWQSLVWFSAQPRSIPRYHGDVSSLSRQDDKGRFVPEGVHRDK